MNIPAPEDDKRYTNLISELRTIHGELRQKNLSENPVLIGDYLGQLRLGANLLFSFLNKYIDLLMVVEKTATEKRQDIYEEQLKLGKSPNSAETHSRNLTRKDENLVKIVEHYINKIKNEYERYNGICMYLQSRMKEFQTERIMG